MISGCNQDMLWLVKQAVEEEGADVHYMGDLAFRYAMREDNKEIMDYLVSKGVDRKKVENSMFRMRSSNESIKDLMTPIPKENREKALSTLKNRDDKVMFLMGLLLNSREEFRTKDNKYMTVFDVVNDMTEEDMDDVIRKQYMKESKSVRNLMTPKSEEDVKYAIKGMVGTQPERFFKYDYMEKSYDYETLSKFVTDKEIYRGMLKMCEGIPFRKGNEEQPKERLAKMMLYLFKNGYTYTDTDGVGVSWFKHHTKSKYNGGDVNVNGFTMMDNLKDYVKRMKEL
jgi:DNA-binding cell septation regulator SpoVG